MSPTEVAYIPDALVELRALAADAGLECDTADSDAETEVWAYRADAPDGEMVWRVRLLRRATLDRS